MKKISILLTLLFSLSLGLWAQENTPTPQKILVKGSIIDSVGHKLSYATIKLYKDGDTTALYIKNTDSTGNFAITPSLPAGNYGVVVQRVGYDPTRQVLKVTDGVTEYNLNEIMLFTAVTDLGDVVVKSTLAVAMNGDTTEMRADAFHTKPNATAEDLLKKLPGVEVDASGNIKAEGESVPRVLVNGKRFFGDDPKMATQNIPKDIVEKIQVYDAQSDQSAFSGFDDGNRTKTINIVIKKENNVGYFGKLTAGAGRMTSNEGGNQNLYSVGGNINRFNNDQKISILGQLNNVNTQMFTTQDLGGGGGRRGGMSGGGRGAGASGSFGGSNSGITKTIASGIRYADKWNTSDVDGSYFYNNGKTWNNSHSERQNLYSDTSNNTMQYDSSNTLSRNQNHRIQFNIDTKLDSVNSLIFRPNMSFISSDNYSESNTKIYDADNGANGALRTNSHIVSQTHNSGFNGSGNLLYMHRFAKAGRTISAGIDWSGNKNDGYGYTTNNIDYAYLDSVSNINRYYTNTSNSNTVGGTLSYTEPIAKYQQLQLEYNHSYTLGNSNRKVWNYDSNTSLYDDLDSTLTNKYKNTYNSDRVTLGYHYNNSVINFSVGSGVQFGNFNSHNESKGIDIKQQYTNFYPTASFRWNIERARRLNFDYSGRTSQPSVSQLQPVLDNSNELNQTVGNPNLKQSFAHSVRLRYFFFNRSSYKHLFSMLNFSSTQNYIANVTTQLVNGGQRTSYQNMNGYYSLTANLDYGFPITTPKSNMSLGSNISLSKTPGMVLTQDKNDTSLYTSAYNSTRNYTFAERIGWTTNLDSLFDINISTQPSYTISRYSLNSGSNANYFSQSVNFEGTYYTSSGWIVAANFNYTYYTGLYNTSVPILNASISKQIFKDKSGEIKFSMNDILNQNKAISNTRSDNYIQTSTNTVLKRYGMISFVWNLKKFGKNQKRSDRNFDGPPEDGKGPGGMPPSGGFGGPPSGGGPGGI